MNHPHAGVALLAGVDDEPTQQRFGRARVGAVQVQLILHRNLPSFQPLQDPRRHRVAAVGEGIAGIEQARIQRMAELIAGFGVVAFSHARARLGLGRVGGGAISRNRRTGPTALRNRSRSSSSSSAPVIAQAYPAPAATQGALTAITAVESRARLKIAIGYHGQRTAEPSAAILFRRCSERESMRVLVSNDDGVDAPGIRILAEGLRAAGHEVLVVAPDRDRSGASNSLTLDMPVRVAQHDAATWRVYGTPTDCVHVAITGMLDVEPDIVVSGINNTANLGDDVIYSGTVAAAMEGRFLGLPAVAVSLVTADHVGKHYETAARAAVEIIARLKSEPLPADTILNVNVPDVPWDDVAGFEVTRLGNRHRAEACIPQQDPRGRQWWWIGAAGREQDAGPGTDFNAVRRGHISITPIHVDLTRYQALEQVASWVGGLAASLQAPEPHASGSAA